MLFTGTIHAGWVIDGSGMPAVPNASVVIKAGRIRAVCSADKGAHPGPGVVNLMHATLLPGLVDSHVHLGLPEHKMPLPASLLAESADSDGDPISKRLDEYAYHGIVGVRDGGDRWGRVLRCKTIYAGKKVSPIVSAPGGAFYSAGRYGGFIGEAVIDADALPLKIAQRASQVDHIKIINSGLNSLTAFGSASPPQFTVSQMTRAVIAAKQHHRAVMVHANGKAPVAIAVDAGCTSIEHGYFMGKDNLKKMRDAQITWVPTAVPMKAFADILAPGSLELDISRRTLDHQLVQMSLARQMGVPVAVGTDAGSPGVAHGAGLIEELKLLRLAGYTIEETVRCAGPNGAALMPSGAVGGLVLGGTATFIAVPGPPKALPESLASICYRCVDGEVMSVER